MKQRLVFTVLLLLVFSVPALKAAASIADPAVTEALPLTRNISVDEDAQKGKPKNVKASATAHLVTLTWTQSPNPTCTPTACPVTGNQVLRGTATGQETLLATLSTPSTQYVDNTVQAGLTYFYEVTAVNANGASGPSAEVSAVIPNQVVPNAPTGLTATPQ